MFKHTNLQAPRTLNDCQFISAGDPIEMHVRPFDWQDKLVMWACIVTAVVSTWVILS